jgi:hypothetical protein
MRNCDTPHGAWAPVPVGLLMTRAIAAAGKTIIAKGTSANFPQLSESSAFKRWLATRLFRVGKNVGRVQKITNY